MAVQTRVKITKLESPKYHGLDRDTLVRLYRTMYLSRRLDDREIQLKRQSKIYFQISSAGHEAVTAAAALLLRPGVDWLYPYYRDRALCLVLGVTPLDTLLQAVGAKDDPSSGGRQMPSHWGHPRWNLVSKSSCTGTQFLHAAGAAEATLYYEHRHKALAQAQQAPLGEHVNYQPEEIVYVSSGDGATSEGEFWESLNVACAKKLPLFYLIEDNGYAISVPVEVQTAGGSISRLVKGFPGLHIAECDGTDPLESYAVCKEAIAYTIDPPQTDELLSEARGTSKLDLRASSAREGPLAVSDVRLTKRGRKLRASAFASAADVRAALPPGFDVQLIGSEGGRVEVRASGGLFGVGASVDAVAEAREGKLVVHPRAPLLEAFKLTLFDEPDVRLTGLAAREATGAGGEAGYELEASATLR